MAGAVTISVIVALAAAVISGVFLESYSYDGTVDWSKKMRTIRSFDKGDIQVVERDIPKPGPGEVLVRMKRAPINPSDTYNAYGEHGHDGEDGVPKITEEREIGYEGSGVVVASGGSILGFIYAYFGLRVAVASRPPHGTWSEYAVGDAMETIPLPEDVDFDGGANTFVNPFTVIGMLNIATEGKHIAMVNTAGSSALGLMLHRAALQYNVTIISVVRGEKNVKILRENEVAAEHIVRSDTDNFQQTFIATTTKFKATIAFDAIGGAFTEILVGLMPKQSEVWAYGRLSGEDTTLAKGDHNGRSFKGYFLMPDYLDAGGLPRVLSTVYTVRSMLADELRTEIKDVIPMGNVPGVLKALIKHQKGGKLLIDFD